MKAKNYVIYGDEEKLRRLKADYDFLGRECAIKGDKLVVFALPRRKEKKKNAQRRGR